MEIQQTQHVIYIGQEKYSREVMKKLNMELVSTPISQNEKFNKEDEVEKVDKGIIKVKILSIERQTIEVLIFRRILKNI